MTVAERAEHAAREAAAPYEKRRRMAVAAGVIVALGLLAGLATAVILSRSDDQATVTVDPTARELGCTSCHSSDGARSEGPTWDGLWGSEVQLDDGTTVVADEAYIRRSIEDPAAQVRMGFSPTMPTIEVSEEQMDDLVAAIRDLQG
jgi:cytochrome c oxidase subunit 2